MSEETNEAKQEIKPEDIAAYGKRVIAAAYEDPASVFAAAASRPELGRHLVAALCGPKGIAVLDTTQAMDALTDEQTAIVAALFALREVHVASQSA